MEHDHRHHSKRMFPYDERYSSHAAPSRNNVFLSVFIGDDGPPSEHMYSISQLAMGFGKKPTSDTLVAATSGMIHSDSLHSFHDIFTTKSSEQAKDLIMSGVRHELYHSRSRATSESGSDELMVSKVDPGDLKAKPTILRVDRGSRKATMLLAGPKFRFHTVNPEVQLKRDTIYPISVSLSFRFAFSPRRNVLIDRLQSDS